MTQITDELEYNQDELEELARLDAGKAHIEANRGDYTHCDLHGVGECSQDCDLDTTNRPEDYLYLLGEARKFVHESAAQRWLTDHGVTVREATPEETVELSKLIEETTVNITAHYRGQDTDCAAEIFGALTIDGSDGVCMIVELDQFEMIWYPREDRSSFGQWTASAFAALWNVPNTILQVEVQYAVVRDHIAEGLVMRAGEISALNPPTWGPAVMALSGEESLAMMDMVKTIAPHWQQS